MKIKAERVKDDDAAKRGDGSGSPDALVAAVGGCTADRQPPGFDPTPLLGARVEGFAGRHDSRESSPEPTKGPTAPANSPTVSYSETKTNEPGEASATVAQAKAGSRNSTEGSSSSLEKVPTEEEGNRKLTEKEESRIGESRTRAAKIKKGKEEERNKHRRKEPGRSEEL